MYVIVKLQLLCLQELHGRIFKLSLGCSVLRKDGWVCHVPPCERHLAGLRPNLSVDSHHEDELQTSIIYLLTGYQSVERKVERRRGSESKSPSPRGTWRSGTK